MQSKEVNPLRHRNKFRALGFRNWLKEKVITWAKGDVPTYITNDVMLRLHNGEQEIVIPLCIGLDTKSIVDYLNEYHNKKTHWTLDFLKIAFDLTEKNIKKKLSKFKDISVELLDISETDKRIVIKVT